MRATSFRSIAFIARSAVLAMALPAIVRADFPLDSAARRCAKSVIGTSVKVLRAYGKAAAKCTKRITSGAATYMPVTPCVFGDDDGKLLAAQMKLDERIGSACSALPYATDCIAPCELMDAGGASSAVDDVSELTDCMGCLNLVTSIEGGATELPLKGLHGAILDDVTLAQASNVDLGDCQSALVKTYDKLFVAEAKELARCAHDELAAGATSPPDSCVGADPRLVVAKARDKLAGVVAECAGIGPIFDAGACMGVTGNALGGCLDTVVLCKVCRWAATQLGSTFDCDEFDDGDANGSCAATM